MQKILILGLGLIGGSLAKALKSKDNNIKIHAFDINFEALEDAKKTGSIDEISSIQKCLDFDLIVISSPLSAYQEVLSELSQEFQNGDKKKPIIIDLGSLKEFVLKEVPQNLRQNFIACHPIAGSDKSGFENSSPDLFFGKKFIICKNENNDESSIKTVIDLAEKIGSSVDFLDAKRHDEIYALVSHLPQFLSFLTKDISPKTIENDFFANCFRLNNSNAEIWGDVFLYNENNIEKFYLEFFDNLENFAKEIKNDNFKKTIENIENITKILPKTLKNDEILPKIAQNQREIDRILFRLIIVASFAKIKKVQDFANYAGTGFRDFTSIIFLAQNNEDFAQLLKENKKSVLKLIKTLDS